MFDRWADWNYIPSEKNGTGVVSVLFSLLRSRLLRPVFIALGLAMLVQVGLAC